VPGALEYSPRAVYRALLTLRARQQPLTFKNIATAGKIASRNTARNYVLLLENAGLVEGQSRRAGAIRILDLPPQMVEERLRSIESDYYGHPAV
jgi:hypothetical protein